MMTVKEAAEVVGVTPRRLRRYIEDGRLPARRVGARLFVLDEEEVRKFRPLPYGRPRKQEETT